MKSDARPVPVRTLWRIKLFSVKQNRGSIKEMLRNYCNPVAMFSDVSYNIYQGLSSGIRL